ncbi:hypothetical protein [Oscillatoria sp. FACHB-1406]|uniref:hypothetical protein n=1 Tax=Oscillatoria sp. FACHB-1406 TaxID=2692846 RepID=UPI0016867DBD|nr:hypothetical protein [Oscillatoria sp. FACHB-1406]MBD2578673.1 hypothetical protein [Oscillatoria sp. FACHB-1406]
MQFMPAIDLATLLHFSHQNCIAICAFLVPATFFTTGHTAWAFLFDGSLYRIRLSAACASVFALLLFLHVSSWFVIGVVTPVTFILSGLGGTCLFVNALAVAMTPDLELVPRLKTQFLAKT